MYKEFIQLNIVKLTKEMTLPRSRQSGTRLGHVWDTGVPTSRLWRPARPGRLSDGRLLPLPAWRRPRLLLGGRGRLPGFLWKEKGFFG